MKKLVLMLIGVSLWSLTALAAEPQIRDGVPERYTVRKGDTLWDISAMFLRDPWLWPQVWEDNPHIENPHLIYPGDVITLVYVDGEPRLRLERGAAAGGRSVPAADGRTVKLSPQIRVTEHEEAIPAVPLEIVTSFLSRNRVVVPGEMEAAPHVVAGSEKRIMSGEGDDFYVRGALADEVDFYGVFRKDDAYVDPDTGEVLGIKALDIGSAQLKRVEDGIATFLATRSAQEIIPGDRLLPHEERRLRPIFYPRDPEQDIRGRIIDVEGGVTQVGTLDVVAINRGEREALQLGDVLAIYKQGETKRDRVTGEMITLPSERAGLLMVFRTFDKMAFGLVMTAGSPLAVGDEVRSP